MIKAATISLSLSVFLAVPTAWSQAPATPAPAAVAADAPNSGEAIQEALRRQAPQISLRQTLDNARAAQARGDVQAAARLYSDAWNLVLQIGDVNLPEAADARAGVAVTHLQLAEAAQHRGDLRRADAEVAEVLRADPTNADAIAFKRANDKMLAEQFPKMPTPDVEARMAVVAAEHATNSTHVQNAKLLFEMGKLDEAESTLLMALREDPQNQGARYYLNLIEQQRFAAAMADKDVVARDALVEIEKEWTTHNTRGALPVPNLYARTNLTFTSSIRSRISAKLNLIRLDNVGWDGLPLSEVVKNLSDEAKKRDPEKRGLNFIINPNAVGTVTTVAPGLPGAPGAPVPPPAGATDPATGLPIAAVAPPEQVDVGAVSIKLSPPLSDVRLVDVLDAITKVADRPIKYSIEDYAVVFSLKGQDVAPLFTRILKVDPNTFEQGLESVVGFSIGEFSGGSGSGGGGGGGQGGGGQNQAAGTAVPRVNLTSGRIGGQGGQGGGAQGGGGGGIKAVTRTNDMGLVQAAVRTFFTSMGIDLNPPKHIFFNDREGSIVVHATQADIDMIETAVQVLNIAPPMINIKSKFVEVGQNDAKALGFDYYLGNFLMNKGTIGASGGTAPSYSGSPSTANPEGSFPGSVVGGTFLPPSSTDGLLSQGLRNQVGVRNAVSTPALGTISGILTDPQFRVVLHALEQRDGVELLNEANVTTMSGRQTEIQVVDLQSIVSSVQLQQTSSGGGGGITGGGAGAIGSQITYTTQSLPVGPTLDVVPYVSADGFTIQMTIIPTVVEFLGYDDPGAFVPQAQSISAGGNGGIPLTAQLPLPRVRLRQVTTSAIVWDGQTVVLGGLISEDVVHIKDKIPVLGDLPFVGRLFRSESSANSKRNLMIFVTPTIIDPAGNPAHSAEEMPFAQTGIPAQRVTVSASAAVSAP